VTVAPEGLRPALTEANYGRVPRVYITCLQDRTISPTRQRTMYTATPCRTVLTLNTGHSPFFSAPEALVAHLLALV
jgi:hypothetical protein